MPDRLRHGPAFIERASIGKLDERNWLVWSIYLDDEFAGAIYQSGKLAVWKPASFLVLPEQLHATKFSEAFEELRTKLVRK